MDTYTTREWLCIHTPIFQLCNVNQITNAFLFWYHAFKCDLVHPHINSWFSFNVALTFDCLLALCGNDCSGDLIGRCTCCHLYYFEGLPIHGWWHSQTENKNPSSYKCDHVAYVWTWHRSKQRLSLYRTFRQFIQHHDVDALHRRTLWSPDVTLFIRVGWYALSGFEFTVVNQLFIRNVSHA